MDAPHTLTRRRRPHGIAGFTASRRSDQKLRTRVEFLDLSAHAVFSGARSAKIARIRPWLDVSHSRRRPLAGFVKPFLKRTAAYESTLVLLQDIIDNWLKVQAAWLYLEPIFSSDDIMKQIPTEGRLFKTVDATWIDSMAQTAQDPALLSVVQRPNLLESLIDANAKLEVIQKGLSDYLETKRLAFPRFFFLSLPARKSLLIPLCEV